jgi:hypothetical protein
MAGRLEFCATQFRRPFGNGTAGSVVGRPSMAAVEGLPGVWLEPDGTRWRYEPECVSTQPHPHVEGRYLSDGGQPGYPLLAVESDETLAGPRHRVGVVPVSYDSCPAGRE